MVDWDALWLAIRFGLRAMGGWYKDNWNEVVGGFMSASVLFVALFRLVFSPILFLSQFLVLGRDYRLIKSESYDREKLRKILNKR